MCCHTQNWALGTWKDRLPYPDAYLIASPSGSRPRPPCCTTIVWYATLKEGTCTVVRGGRPAKLPDVVFHQSPETFLRIVDKTDPLNPTTAALQGLLVVDGDMHFAWAMLEENIEG